MGTNIVEMVRGDLRPTTPCLPLVLGRLLHGLSVVRPLRRNLTATETGTLKSLLPAYRTYLEPGPREEISGLLTRLRAIYFVPEMSTALANAGADDWADDLGRFPLWAVKAACDRYRQNEGTKTPKPANIIAFCEEEIEEEQREIYQIELALSASPLEPEPDRVTPEQVAAIHEKYGIGKMVAEAETAKRERKRPDNTAPIHRRAHDAAMEEITAGREGY